MKQPQLFLMHFAGGNCYSFTFLKEQLSPHFELHFLELPGRGKRIAEPLINNRKDAVNDYVEQIVNRRSSEQFLIYGHSMGGHLGISVANQLEQMGKAPKALVFTGNAGPGVAEVKNCYLMSDGEFKNHLRELGGVSDEVLEHQELYDFFAPVLRMDFEILEKEGDPELDIRVNTPIYAMMGTEEKYVGHIENWKKYTSDVVEIKKAKGGHFFIHDQVTELVQFIRNAHDRALVH